MSRTRSCALAQHVGSRIRIRGWLAAIRRLGKLAFIVVRDGWGTVQVTAGHEALAAIDRAGAKPESIVSVVGLVQENPRAPGGFELVDPVIEVELAVGEALPVPLGRALERAKLPSLFDHAPTVLRDPSRRAVFDLAAGAMAGFRRGLSALG